MFRIFSDLSNFDFWHKKIKNHWEENIKELEKNISHKITDCIVTSSQAKDDEAFESGGEKDL